MTFANPAWLWALGLLPLLAALFVRAERWRHRALATLVAPRLQRELVRGASPGRRRLGTSLALASLALVILALARPQAGFVEERLPTVGRDILIGIDTSRSMLAPDLPPSRLARAKLCAEDLISALRGDRIGLLAFAGTAFLQAPLTADHDAVLDSLRELDTGIIPRGGTSIAAAIRTALEAFGKAETGGRALVLLTDGEELEADGVAAAREASAAGIRIFLVGVGTPEGALIPLPGGSFVKDPAGNVVRSRLDESRLRAIAEAAQAKLFLLGTAPSPAPAIADAIRSLAASETAGQLQRTPIEYFQWPLGAALLLLTLALILPETRREASANASAQTRTARRPTAAILAISPLLATALTPLGADQALTEYEAGNYARARELFEQRADKSPVARFNAGTAAYRLGDWAAAEQAFAASLAEGPPSSRARAAYNLGNTLVRRAETAPDPSRARNDLEDAIRHYEQALALDPGLEAARKNRAAAQKRLEALQPPPSSPKPSPEASDSGNEKPPEQSQSQPQNPSQPQDSSQPQESSQSQESSQPDESSQESSSNQTQEAAEQQPGSESPNPSDSPGSSDAQNPSGAEERSSGEETSPPGGSQNATGADGESRSEAAVPPERERSGQVRSATGSKEPTPSPAPDPGALAEEAQAAQEGRMTEAQAAALLDSMRNRDVRVPLIERRAAGRVSKDW